MSISEKSYRITNLSVTAPNEPWGLAICITGMPILGNDNVVRVGAAGQGAVGKNIRTLFKQVADYDLGENTRILIGDDERDLPSAMAKRVADGDFSIDFALDDGALLFAIGQMLVASSENKMPVGIVETKLMPQLLLLPSAPQLHNIPDFKRNIIPIMIGITSTEQKANERKVSASRIKANVKNDPSLALTLEQASQLRAARYVNDAQKYLGAYGIEYSPDSVAKSVHIVFDNTPDRSGLEMQAELCKMLRELSQVYQVVAPYLNDVLVSNEA